jgi:hypothetical protein
LDFWRASSTGRRRNSGGWGAGTRSSNGFVVEALHELYASDGSTTPDYYDIATAAWATRWPVEDLWSARLDQ